MYNVFKIWIYWSTHSKFMLNFILQKSSKFLFIWKSILNALLIFYRNIFCIHLRFTICCYNPNYAATCILFTFLFIHIQILYSFVQPCNKIFAFVHNLFTFSQLVLHLYCHYCKSSLIPLFLHKLLCITAAGCLSFQLSVWRKSWSFY